MMDWLILGSYNALKNVISQLYRMLASQKREWGPINSNEIELATVCAENKHKEGQTDQTISNIAKAYSHEKTKFKQV